MRRGGGAEEQGSGGVGGTRRQGEGERERRGLTSITRRLQPGVGEDEDTDACTEPVEVHTD